MKDKEEPVISDYEGITYTKITFIPDFKKFGVE